jgi:hypothetical protein
VEAKNSNKMNLMEDSFGNSSKKEDKESKINS